MTVTTLESPPIHTSWWLRNWKWAVPAIAVGGLVIIALFVVAIYSFILGIFRNNDAYATAVARARANSIVIQELGEPIEVGWSLAGTVKINGPSGSADFAMPLKGPHGRGTLYVTATKSADLWQYSVLEVAIEGRDERVKLLGDRDGV